MLWRGFGNKRPGIGAEKIDISWEEETRTALTSDFDRVGKRARGGRRVLATGSLATETMVRQADCGARAIFS